MKMTEEKDKIVEEKDRTEDKTEYALEIVTEAKGTLSEGREELREALKYMNEVKKKASTWHNDTQSFLQDVTQEYQAKAEELEATSSKPKVLSKIRAAINTLPALINREEDPTKRRFGKVLNTLVYDAEDIYGSLDVHLCIYEKRFEKVDELNGSLIKDLKKYSEGLEESNKGKKKLDKRLKTLEEKLLRHREKGTTGRAYLSTQEEILEKKRELEEVSAKRTLLLNKYKGAVNILETLSDFRDEQKIMLTEGRNLYESLKTNIESLKPLFDQIATSADLVEFQNKASEAYEILKDTFNPAMIAITAVSKGISKVATEQMGEKFIEDKTMEAVRYLTDGHKKELEKRSEKEDMAIDDILKNKGFQDDDDITLELQEDGKYGLAPEEEEEVPEEAPEEKKE